VSGSNVENVSPQVVRRVTKEVMELAESPPEGIKVFINEEDITDIQATITGPGKNNNKLGCFNIWWHSILRVLLIRIGSINHRYTLIV
jgi:ubiquitin-conjugating enzyme E2 S